MIWSDSKMLRQICAISAILAVASATGTLSILEYPKSLEFKGDEPLSSESLGDVFGAALGYSVVHPSDWSGLFVNNPFEPAQAVVTLIVNGIDNINLDAAKPVNFLVDGSDGVDSLDSLLSRVREHNGLTADLDLSQGIDTVHSIFGPLNAKTDKTVSSLKPQTHPEDKLFLEQIAAINDLADKFSTLKNLPIFTEINLSLASLVSAHSKSSAAVAEALKLLSAAAENLATSVEKAYDGNAVVAVVTNNEHTRRRRAATQEVDPNQLNLAASYSEDYPVIFNIILWFGVVITFSLFAIAYVIAYMDPGRDSIIYRMTSTRMKKDN